MSSSVENSQFSLNEEERPMLYIDVFGSKLFLDAKTSLVVQDNSQD